MTLYINNGRDGNPSKLGGDIDASSCKIEFTEAIYSLDASGNFGTLTYVNVSTTDSKAISPNNDLKNGDIVQLKFTVKDYETEYSGKKSAKTATAKQVKWSEVFTAQMALGTAFSGQIALAADLIQLDALITKKDPQGRDIPEFMLDMMSGTGFKLVPCELDKLKDITVSSGGSYGSKKAFTPAQTELQKLTDNLTFIKSLEVEYGVKLLVTDVLHLIYKVNLNPASGNF